MVVDLGEEETFCTYDTVSIPSPLLALNGMAHHLEVKYLA